MLDPLVHRQDGEVARAAEPAMGHDALQVAEHAVVAVRDGIQAVHHVRPGKVQTLLRDLGVLEVEQGLGLVAEQLCD